MTDAASPFVLDGAAAFGAGAAVLAVAGHLLVIQHVHLDRLGHRVGAGGDAVVAEAGRLVSYNFV